MQTQYLAIKGIWKMVLKKGWVFMAATLAVLLYMGQTSAQQIETSTISPTARWGKGRFPFRDKAVAFSHDGQLLAVASSTGIYFYDVPTLGERALLPTTGSVISVAFSPDGKTLASGSDDQKVELWDVATGYNIATLEGHAHRVESVAFSRDGTILASGGSSGTILLWDIAKRENIATLEGHTTTVTSLSFSLDGKTLASGSNDDTVRLWDVAKGQYHAELRKGEDGQWGINRVFSIYGRNNTTVYGSHRLDVTASYQNPY